MATRAPEKEDKKKDKDAPDPVLVAEPGSSKQHFSINVKFPVYAIDYLQDRVVLLAGGGGSSRTGVKNRLVRVSSLSRRAVSPYRIHEHTDTSDGKQSLYKINTVTRQFDLIEQHELSKEEDAPMTVAIHEPVRFHLSTLALSRCSRPETTDKDLSSRDQL
jgi:prolactin regulatory element-binding protein